MKLFDAVLSIRVFPTGVGMNRVVDFAVHNHRDVFPTGVGMNRVQSGRHHLLCGCSPQAWG